MPLTIALVPAAVSKSDRNTASKMKKSSSKNNNSINLVVFTIVAIVIIGSVMVECASSLQDYEYMDLKDLYDMMQQNAMRPKKSPRAEKGQPLRMRFGRRSDPWMMPGPMPLQGNSLGGNAYYPDQV